ncbi:retrotransposon protein [Cucumis melo var. makuwa]|uniref:Retrotransposon protein n=1 Tax=Cucumis melo var. makuwa TaxID=1194695 RepID=A0A5D3CBY3_CUCMM|nr:retrotransposon protein [Cucumis melo var. makuwa]
MDRRCFAILCHLLRTIARLTSAEVVDVEKMVAMFLHILAHDVKNRVIRWEFMQSDETISRHFNMVLLVVIRFMASFLKNQNQCLTIAQIKDGGALDRTYIKVNVPASDRARINCGLMHPSDAISRPNGLKEWCGAENAPSTSKEFFNMKHSSARNVIERAFGVLKEDDIDEVYSTDATTAADDIHYIETSNEWTRWKDDLAEEMFSDWDLRNHMPSSSRLPKHNWTKKEEAGLVKYLMELVNAGGWRSDNGTFRPGYLIILEKDK